MIHSRAASILPKYAQRLLARGGKPHVRAPLPATAERRSGGRRLHGSAAFPRRALPDRAARKSVRRRPRAWRPRGSTSSADHPAPLPHVRRRAPAPRTGRTTHPRRRRFSGAAAVRDEEGEGAGGAEPQHERHEGERPRDGRLPRRGHDGVGADHRGNEHEQDP